MHTSYKKTAVLGAIIAIVLMISFPTSALTSAISFKNKTDNDQRLKDIVSNVAQRVRKGIKKVVEKAKGFVPNSKTAEITQAGKINAKRVSINADLLKRPWASPFLLADDSNSPINISNIVAEPQFGPPAPNASVNITCLVNSTEGDVDTVKVNITDPTGNTVGNFSMINRTSKEFYYEQNYSTNGTFRYVIWANDTLGNSSTSDEKKFHIGDWPPEISSVNHDKNDRNVNITCEVTSGHHEDYNITDNVTLVQVYVVGNETGTHSFTMANINGTNTYYSASEFDNDTYTYYIVAVDTRGNENLSESTGYSFTIGEETITKHTQITSFIGKEQHPTVVKKNDLLHMLYDGASGQGETDIFIQESTDMGQNWSEASRFSIEGNQSYPDLCIDQKGNIYGTFQSEYARIENQELFSGDTIIYVREDGSFSWWGWSSFGYTNFTKPTITEYKSNENIPWVISTIGSRDSDSSTFSQSPLIVFPDPTDEDYAWLVEDPQNFTENCDNISIDYNSATGNITAVYELQNGSLGFINIDDIEWSQGSPIISYELQILGQTSNNSHPDITTHDGDIYIATETKTNEEYDIVSYVSVDNGKNWSIEIISATSGLAERYPTLYTGENEVFCAYHKGGNIVLAQASDWQNTVETISDPAGRPVVGYRMVDIADQEHILWTDSRTANNDYDIWISILGVKPKPPAKKVDLQVVDGSLDLISASDEGSPLGFNQLNNELVFTIENIGEKNITQDIEFSIYYFEQNETGANIRKTLIDRDKIRGPLNIGESKTVDRLLFNANIKDLLYCWLGWNTHNGLVSCNGLERGETIYENLKRITKINVTLDPDNDTGDLNHDNNNRELTTLDFNISHVDVDTVDEEVKEGGRFDVQVAPMIGNRSFIFYGSIRKFDVTKAQEFVEVIKTILKLAMPLGMQMLQEIIELLKEWLNGVTAASATDCTADDYTTLIGGVPVRILVKLVQFALKLNLPAKTLKLLFKPVGVAYNHLGFTMTDNTGQSLWGIKTPKMTFLRSPMQMPLLVINTLGGQITGSSTITSVPIYNSFR